MEQHLQTEETKQTPTASPLRNQVEPSEEQHTDSVSQEKSAVSTEKVQTESLDTLLKSLKWQAKLHGTFSTISALVIGGTLFCLIMGVIVYCAMSGLNHHAVKLIFDSSLTNFGVSGVGGNGNATMTVSGTAGPLLLAASGLLGFLTKRQRIKLTSMVSRYEDVRSVGLLIEALYLQDKATRSVAAEALIRILPQLTREDAHLLNSNQRTLLMLYLGRSRWSLLQDNEDLSLAILQAYSRIGDGTELRTVRHVAAGKGTAGKDPRVRQAAQSYLEEVQRQKEQEQMPQVLLRASDNSATTADVLLRPAQEKSSVDPQELLRSSNVDETE